VRLVAWRIVDGPGEGPWEGRDAVGWIWTIENDAGETRRILVEVSGTAMAVAEYTLPDEVRSARQSRGRSAVETVLVDEHPTRRISFTTVGVSAAE
jgi:hypothetical protein